MSIFLLIPSFISAQPGNTKPEENQDVKKKKPIEVSAETKEKANKMLVDVSKDAGQLALPDNRIRAQMVIADLLWEQDEKEGRAIFQNNVQTI